MLEIGAFGSAFLLFAAIILVLNGWLSLSDYNSGNVPKDSTSARGGFSAFCALLGLVLVAYYLVKTSKQITVGTLWSVILILAGIFMVVVSALTLNNQLGGYLPDDNTSNVRKTISGAGIAAGAILVIYVAIKWYNASGGSSSSSSSSSSASSSGWPDD